VDRGKLPRLVLTGGMGAGKTAACILFIIELAERDVCLPVLFPLATWDPGTSLEVSRPGFLGGCDFWESWGCSR
jgi:hypothetical protein